MNIPVQWEYLDLAEYLAKTEDYTGPADASHGTAVHLRVIGTGGETAIRSTHRSKPKHTALYESPS